MIKFSKPAQVVKVLALAAFIFVTVQSPAFAENVLDFTLFNDSDKTIYRLYVYASNVCGIGVNGHFPNADLLGFKMLKHGEQIDIVFGEHDTYAYWDVAVEFEDDNRWSWKNIELKNVSRMTVAADGKAYFE